MKASILSDMHIDFHIHQTDPNRIKDHTVYDAFCDYLEESEDVEVLILAGDIGHYNKQAQQVLKVIGRLFNYRKIFCVLGNHDLYETSKHSSINRLMDWWNFKDPDGVIEILNGNVVEFKGIRFGGAMGWYDASYLKNFNTEGDDVISLWRNTMNDGHYIKELGNFMDIYETERPKLEDVHKRCDVMLSHVNPSNSRDHVDRHYRDDISTAFYAFDGDDLLLNTTASYWFYGHSHGQFNYNKYGVECIMNTRGYPAETAKRLTVTLDV